MRAFGSVLTTNWSPASTVYDDWVGFTKSNSGVEVSDPLMTAGFVTGPVIVKIGHTVEFPLFVTFTPEGETAPNAIGNVRGNDAPATYRPTLTVWGAA